jgi:ATP-dependent Clp protease ATP-binding subunit ClpC
LQVCESLLSNLQEQNNKRTGKKGSGPELVTGVGSDTTRTPTLAEVGTDLTQLAKDGLLDPVFGRDAEIRACLRTLLRRRKNNVVLLGEPGTGKTAIAEGVAQLLVSDECPRKLKLHRLVSLELASLVAGTKYRGEFEERLKSVLDEVLDPKAPPTILFVDEIHNLVGAGAAEGGMDAANLLKPALARGEMQLIGATTIAEYRKYIEKDGALERRLQPVMVRETSVDQTVGILKALQSNYEQHHGVSYTSAALYAAAALSERYISDRFLPDKAIDLVDEAGATAHLESGEGPEARPVVDEHVVAQVVAEMTGIPVGKLESTEMDRLQSLESELEARVKGQRRAVHAVARAIRRARSGLRDPKRPVASFLLWYVRRNLCCADRRVVFIANLSDALTPLPCLSVPVPLNSGGTGTGKTELCKTLAETYYGSEKDMIRIDMSEYMDKHTVSRLVGSPPGFIGTLVLFDIAKDCKSVPPFAQPCSP